MNKKYNLSTFAARLTKRRLNAHLTRDQLAVKACVNYNTIIKLESGSNKNPTINTLVGLARVFQVTVEELLTK